MRLLYLIFVLSVAALIWIAFAITRHIRRHQALADSQIAEASDMPRNGTASLSPSQSVSKHQLSEAAPSAKAVGAGGNPAWSTGKH